MDSLPELQPSPRKSLKLTVEVLRRAPVAEALSRDLSELATTYRNCPEEAIFVRIAFAGGHLDGWYRPADREFEPVGIWNGSEIA